MGQDTQLSISFIILIVGFGITLFNFSRTKSQDLEKRAQDHATTSVKLDNITTILSEVRIDQKAQSKLINNLEARMSVVENSTSALHKRLDEVERNTKHD